MRSSMSSPKSARCSVALSLLIPWSHTDGQRARTFKWLRRYWRHELPEAEIIIGRSRGRPFCKTQAFNDAASRSHGRVLVLLDADAYLPGSIIRRAAQLIEADLASEDPLHLWFVPYRRLYRLNEETTERVLASDPKDPWRPPDPCPEEFLEGESRIIGYGRRYGAMLMVIPREAYDVLGGFDERFRGWGGEDMSMVRALDTLWGKHKSLDTAIYHLWHERVGSTYRERLWPGQTEQHPNDRLSNQYHRASRSPAAMRALVDAGLPAPQTRLGRVLAAILRVLRT